MNESFFAYDVISMWAQEIEKDQGGTFKGINLLLALGWNATDFHNKDTDEEILHLRPCGMSSEIRLVWCMASGSRIP